MAGAAAPPAIDRSRGMARLPAFRRVPDRSMSLRRRAEGGDPMTGGYRAAREGDHRGLANVPPWVVAALFIVPGIAAPVLTRYLPRSSGFGSRRTSRSACRRWARTDRRRPLVRGTCAPVRPGLAACSWRWAQRRSVERAAAFVLASPSRRVAFLWSKPSRWGWSSASGSRYALAAWLYSACSSTPPSRRGRDGWPVLTWSGCRRWAALPLPGLGQTARRAPGLGCVDVAVGLCRRDGDRA